MFPILRVALGDSFPKFVIQRLSLRKSLIVNFSQAVKRKGFFGLATGVSQCEREIEEIESESAASIAWLAEHQEIGTLSEIVDQKFTESVKQQAIIEQLQAEIGQKRSDVLSQARVVACTAYRPLLDKDVAEMKFDCVVVDEASMLPLPLYFCVASLARSRIVIAGDFRQLPPIVRANAPVSTDAASLAQQKKYQRDLTFLIHSRSLALFRDRRPMKGLRSWLHSEISTECENRFQI